MLKEIRRLRQFQSVKFTIMIICPSSYKFFAQSITLGAVKG